MAPRGPKKIDDVSTVKTIATVEKKRFYVVGKRGFTFFVPSVYPEGSANEGKFVPVLDAAGREKFQNGVPLYQSSCLSFTPINTRPGQSFCCFECDEETPKNVLEFLEKRAADSSSEVMSEEAYKKWADPKSFAERALRESAERNASDLELVNANLAEQLRIAREEIERMKG